MDSLLLGIIVYAGLLYSVVLHEVAHGYLAEQLGDNTARHAGRLTLNPLSHLDPFGSFLLPLITYFMGFPFGYAKPVPYNPNHMRNRRSDPLKVMAAGPATNIALAILLGLVVRMMLATQFGPIEFVVILNTIIYLNLLLAVFNLIPIPPFDGRFIIGLFSPAWLLRTEIAMARMGGGGFILGILIAIVFFLPLVFPLVPYFTAALTGIPAQALPAWLLF